MAKVYLLVGVEYYEDSPVIGVFSSPRKAKAFLSKNIIYKKEFDGYRDEYVIEEYEVDSKVRADDNIYDNKEVFKIKEKEILALRQKKGLSIEY